MFAKPTQHQQELTSRIRIVNLQISAESNKNVRKNYIFFLNCLKNLQYGIQTRIINLCFRIQAGDVFINIILNIFKYS